MSWIERRRTRRLDRLVGLPMLDREVGDQVFVAGISWVWGRIYLFSRDRRAAVIETAIGRMFWAGSAAILDGPPPGYEHVARLARPALARGKRAGEDPQGEDPRPHVAVASLPVGGEYGPRLVEDAHGSEGGGRCGWVRRRHAAPRVYCTVYVTGVW